MNISDKVVCVDDSPNVHTGQRPLESNKVYVVEGVDTTRRICGTVGLYLVGIPSYIDEDGSVIGWRHTRFRLLDACKAAAASAAAAQKQQQQQRQTK